MRWISANRGGCLTAGSGPSSRISERVSKRGQRTRETMNHTTAGKQGFSLVELMIVVSIVGILTAVAIPSFGGYLQRTKKSEVGAQLKAMFVGASAYYSSEFTDSNDGAVRSSCAVGAVPQAIEDAVLGNHRVDLSSVYSGPTAHPSFRALAFAPSEALYHAYNIAESLGPECDIGPSTPKVYILEAAGDIDGDDVVEAHQVTVSSTAGNALQRLALVERIRN